MTVTGKYKEQQQWFIDRVGKVVYRTKGTCPCLDCDKSYKNGVTIMDENHAHYLNDISAEIGMNYFDTIEERDEQEAIRSTLK